jgi:MFS transporter, OFA family, oxalate/formate antiporter
MAKWFPDKRGLAIGLAVGGYGAGSAIFGPLAQLEADPGLRPSGHLPDSGRNLLVMTLFGAFLLKNPPAGYKPAGWTPAASKSAATTYEFSPAKCCARPPST